jgi:hypothetical protein
MFRMFRKRRAGVLPGTPLTVDAGVVEGHPALLIDGRPIVLPDATAQGLVKKLLVVMGGCKPDVFQLGTSGTNLRFRFGGLTFEVEPAEAQCLAEDIFFYVGQLTGKTFALVTAEKSWDTGTRQWRNCQDEAQGSVPGRPA